MIYFIEVLLITLLASHGTHQLVLTKKFHPVRASSFLTLLFIGLTSLYPIPQTSAVQAAFFGASFIGMSDSTRLTKWQLTLSGIVYALIYCFLIKRLSGIGGALGFSAFTSCLVIFWSGKLLKHKPTNKVSNI